MGVVVSVLMGMILTLPISSADLGVILNLSGLAAGAATVGCCCNMIGFAVASYRENKIGGLLAQGIGTSMLSGPQYCASSADLDPGHCIQRGSRTGGNRGSPHDKQCPQDPAWARRGLVGAAYDMAGDDTVRGRDNRTV